MVVGCVGVRHAASTGSIPSRVVFEPQFPPPTLTRSIHAYPSSTHLFKDTPQQDTVCRSTWHVTRVTCPCATIPSLTHRLVESRVREESGPIHKTIRMRGIRMEKQLSAPGFWLGLICTVLALIFRFLAAFNIIVPPMGTPGGNAISYLSFLHGAMLFFLLTIACWCRTAKS